MSAQCPNGHTSNDLEWCDTCGAPLAGGTATATPAAAAPSSTSSTSSTTSASLSTAAITCPSCSEINPESNLFCETCGLDFVTGQKPADPVAPPPATATTPLPASPPPDPGEDLGWRATTTVDTEWFAAKGEGIGTPPTRSAHVVELRHHSVVIGRTRSSGNSPGLVVDDDHGISRRHAELTFDPVSNTWSVIDLASTNGTFVLAEGDALDPSLAPIEPNIGKLLNPTDRVFVGAWTRVELSPLELKPLDVPVGSEDPLVEPAQPASSTSDPAGNDPAGNDPEKD